MWRASQLIPSSFSSPFMTGVCCTVSVPSWVFVLRSPQELSIMPPAEGDFSHLHPLPDENLGVQYHPWLKIIIRGQPLLPHSISREQGWGHLIATLGFGVFWFISSSCPSLSLDNLLYREDFSWSAHSIGVT